MIKIWSKFHIQILWYSFTRDNSFILTPSSYLPGKQENPSSSASSQNVYLFLNSEVINGEIAYRSRELLKAFFCHQKTVRKQTCSAWNFLQPSIQVCRGAYIPYFKNQHPLFLLLHLFWRSRPSVQDQKNCKRTYCWLPF